ncbi:MAG: biopolymer transporter ExbD [Polyangiales bacterium]
MAKKKNNNDNESKKPGSVAPPRALAGRSSLPPPSAYRESMAPPVAEQPASMSYVKRLVRAKIRRRSEEEHHGINIYPMMDMMTILLVFMVMQFASSTAAVIQESDELKIPYSTSELQLGESVPIQISQSEILVDGIKAVDLRNGIVDPSFKKGGSTGFLITPLSNKLSTVRDARKFIAQNDPKKPFIGEVQIIADKRTPFRTLSEVIYTLGQNEFKNLRFVTNKTPKTGK